jgi:CRP/FNR family transcriptional regulator
LTWIKRADAPGDTMEPMADASLLVKRFPAFAGLAAARLQALLAEAQFVRAPAGATVVQPGQACQGLPLVLEGSVRLVKQGPNGREILLYRVEPGTGCILSIGCLFGHANHSASGIADENVVLLVLPPAAFHELLLEHEPFRRFVFGMYAERLAEVMELVEEVAFRKLDQRLALHLVQRGPVIEATHQRLADELGSVREIVSRLLRSFEGRGWLRLERSHITLVDRKSLAALAGESA